MALKLVHRLVFIHEDACSCSGCCSGEASRNEVEQFWFDVEGGEEGGGGGKNHIVNRMVKNRAVMRLALGPTSKNILRELSVQLTPTTAAVLAFEHGKLVFARPLIITKLDDCKMGLEVRPRNYKKQSVDGNSVLYKTSLNHSSNDSAGLELGWPLGLNGVTQAIQGAQDELRKTGSKSTTESSALSWPFCAEKYILFSYEELRRVTSDFSPGNLVGIGGSSRVYKGRLPNGKLVAVKIFRSYKEACEDFFTEINITSSLSHKHIVPLVGVCLDKHSLMSVYDLLPQGSLEEHLHGCKRKPGLPWEARFKVAVGVAEALMYLHDKRPLPVIHRDVTSSNILLSNDFHPQLSDFGLAMRGSTSENTQILTKDALGTFGYIAPEYFMHGNVSDKIDVYSYGVVLLELLSGRRPVNLRAQRGQESLVKWAKRMIDRGDVSSLLDPKLGDTLGANQIQTMVSAAYFCTKLTAEHRPKMSQICKLMKGEMSVEQLIKSERNHLNEEQELWDSYLSNSVLKMINDSTRTIRPGLQRRKTLSDCLQECEQRFTLADLVQQEHH